MKKIKFVNGQAPALNAQNLNQMQDNIEEAISYSEEALSYSTEEQVIGKWIDGKPIYRKVLVGTLPAPDINGGNWIGACNNISNLVDIYGDVFGRPYNYLCVNRNNTITLALDFVVSNNTIMYRNLGYAQGSAYNIVIEYTKTTD